MRKRWKLITIFCFAAVLIQGCATLNGTVPFKYVPSLATGEPSNLRLGMEKLDDKRPDDDRLATKTIDDVDEKVTAKLLEDFRSSQMFSVIDFPIQKDKDDLIMKGEIRRFYWELHPIPIVFIPFINILLAFDIPTYYADGTTELNVKLVSSNTGKVLAEYDKTSTKTETYSLYNFKDGEEGAELAEAFREVSKQLKEAILSDIKAGRLKE
jgi:hypothetical protein